MKYHPTIGLEVHAELKTRTKMFCDSLNDPDEKDPNTNVCPVCLGHPGALPTINKQAVEQVIKVGLAIGSAVSPVSKFDRKNYFYPDLPKGYQISQSDKPLVVGGSVKLPSGTTVKVHHIHLEEDAGKLVHDDATGSTLVDYNRASVPLMELVTEPDIHSPEDAVAFMKEIQLLLRYLGVADADLERGQMRADANISLSADPPSTSSGQGKLGTRAEVKNINSFNAVLNAIKFEIKRQTELLDKGEKVHQETRGWDDVKQRTVSQRSKEHAHDYRYFPEPDLPPFEPPKVFNIDDMRRHMPELPRVKQVRFAKEFGVSDAQAATLVESEELGEFFEDAYSELATRLRQGSGGQARDEKTTAQIDKRPAELLYNYLTSDLWGAMRTHSTSFGNLKVSPEEFAHLIDLIADAKIGSRQAKDILDKMVRTGEDPETILNAEGLHTVSGEDELGKIVDEIIAENPNAVADFKKGKIASLQFLIGKAMGKLKGRGNPGVLKALFEKKLS